MKNDFQKMVKRAVEIKAKYKKIEPKPWGVEQAFMGMMKDVGELSKLIMIKKGYRTDSDKKLHAALEHQLSDILYSILIIADKTKVDLEKSFWRTMDEIEQRLKK